MSQLNNSFGSGGMSLALSEPQFSHFFQYLKGDMSGLPIVKAVNHIGDQGDGVWVLNKSTHINASGVVVEKCNQEYVWLMEALATCISIQSIVPSIQTPLSSNILNP